MKALRIILFNILLLFLLLIILEVSLRIFSPNYSLYRRTFPNQFPDRLFDKSTFEVKWPKKEPDLGWVCSNDSLLKFSNPKYNDSSIVYKINKQGFRNKLDFDSFNSKNEKIKIMLLGESFIMSVYLQEEKTISYKLSKDLGDNYIIYNLGIPGYGIDQMLLSYEKYSPVLNPDIVVLFYIDEDIPRVLEAYRKVEGMNKPSFDICRDVLVPRTINNQNLIDLLAFNSHLINRFYNRYIKNYSIQITEKIFERLYLSCKSKDRQLIVIRCPTVEVLLTEQDFSVYSFSEFFENRDVSYLELYYDLVLLDKPHLKNLYLVGDGHPSNNGARYFAKVIEKEIRKFSF